MEVKKVIKVINIFEYINVLKCNLICLLCIVY